MHRIQYDRTHCTTRDAKNCELFHWNDKVWIFFIQFWANSIPFEVIQTEKRTFYILSLKVKLSICFNARAHMLLYCILSSFRSFHRNPAHSLTHYLTVYVRPFLFFLIFVSFKVFLEILCLTASIDKLAWMHVNKIY